MVNITEAIKELFRQQTLQVNRVNTLIEDLDTVMPNSDVYLSFKPIQYRVEVDPEEEQRYYHPLPEYLVDYIYLQIILAKGKLEISYYTYGDSLDEGKFISLDELNVILEEG